MLFARLVLVIMHMASTPFGILPVLLGIAADEKRLLPERC